MHVHDLMDFWAQRAPEDLAAFDGERSITWRELRTSTCRMAQWLSQSLQPEARFGVLSTNSIEQLALYFAASRAGVVPVPLNTRLAPPEWAWILEDAGVHLLVAEDRFGAAIDGLQQGRPERLAVIGEVRPGWEDFGAGVSACPAVDPCRALPDDGPLWQMYTSGTTGHPKGAVVSQRAAIANVVQSQASIGMQRCRGLLSMPLFHAGAAMQMLHYTYVGACARIATAFEPGAMIRILREEHISISAFVPAMIQTLLQHPDVAVAPYPALSLIAYGASPIASNVLRRAIEVFGCRFLQAYGMTETSAAATHLSPEDHLRALASDERLLLSCGRPLMGTQLRVVDKHNRDVPRGHKGEILVRGDQVMTAYWNRPDATAEALRGGWLHTGDAGHLDEQGYLFLSDRVKDMIVSGGENVYPREIEEALMLLDGVADVAVVGVPDERWGEAAKAFVVRVAGAALTAETILAHCRSRLAGYKCPRSVEFVESLPRNATGKVLKRELRAPYWQGRTRAVN